jgi:hypothetical protein
VLDWLVKCLGLPEKFLSSNQEPFGGGALQVFSKTKLKFNSLILKVKMVNTC